MYFKANNEQILIDDGFAKNILTVIVAYCNYSTEKRWIIQ